MTRKISVELVGDDQSLQRVFKRSSSGAKTFERDISKASRGAIAASLSFRGLGRSASFASGYLIGGAGLAYGLKKSVEGAESLEKAQRSLGVVIRRNGGNFKDQLPQIEHWAAAQARFGVSTVQSEQGLARATVITGSAVKGMRAYTEALEISKATGRSFTTVLLAAAKANEGQTTALARYIGKIPTGTSTMKLFTDIQAKYKGQAEANTTATEKLGAALSNIETTVGTALLPTINKYASELTAWLGKSKNQEHVQRDVNEVVREGAHVVKTIGGVVQTTTHLLGGFKGTMEAIVAIKVVSTLTKWRLAMAAFGLSAGTAGAAGEVGVLLATVRKLAAIGAVSIAFKFPGLSAKLAGILGVPAGVTAAAVGGVLASSGGAPNVPGLPTKGKGALVSDALQKFTQAQMIQARIDSGVSGSDTVGAALKNKAFVASLYRQGVAAGIIKPPPTPTRDRGFRDAKLGATGGGGPNGVGVGGLDGLSSIQNAVSSARLGVARGDAGAKQQLVAALKAQIDYDRKYEGVQAGLIKRRVGDVKKHAQTLQRLQADEAGALDEINSMTAKATAAVKKKAKNKSATALGFAVPVSLLIAQAKASASASDKDDRKVASQIKRFTEKMIRSGKLRGQALIDAWDEIANQNSVLANNATQSVKRTNHSVAVSTAKITAGLHLSSAVRKELEARFAQAEAHSGHVPTGHAVGGVTIHTLNVTANNADHLIDQIQKKARHAAVQTRGPNAGRNPRVH